VPVEDTYLTSPYGMRLHPILDVWKLHDGVDLHAPCGTPIHAAAPGTVVSEGREGSYGNQLRLDHGRVHGVELATSYNHLSSYVAQVGQQVDRGQLIAYAGSTGLATACHLHFMVYVNGVAVDPTRWL
jgi:murein DD-endopeptidase MepM/ murein hydrolase activator NlpD